MSEFFKPNPYYNTMWTNRDQEFYWTGCKNGMVIGAIGATILIGWVTLVIPEWIEKIKQENAQ